MTTPTPLSPAAQAVLDAVEDDCIHPSDKHRLAAAALRAAAEECQGLPDGSDCTSLLAEIAAELDGTNTQSPL